jgi:hypothetical protein
MADQALIDAAGDLFDDLGEPATYNGTAITILVESYGQTAEQSPGIRMPDATVYVRGADVAQPKKNDTVAWGGSSYRVVGDPEADGQRTVWKLTVNRNVVQA